MFSQLVEYHIRNDLNLIKQSVLTFNSFFLRVGFLFLFFEESFRGLVFLVATAMTNCRQTYPELKHHCCIVLLHIYIYVYGPFFQLVMSMEELCTSALAFSKSPFSLRKKHEKNRS